MIDLISKVEMWKKMDGFELFPVIVHRLRRMFPTTPDIGNQDTSLLTGNHPLPSSNRPEAKEGLLAYHLVINATAGGRRQAKGMWPLKMLHCYCVMSLVLTCSTRAGTLA